MKKAALILILLLTLPVSGLEIAIDELKSGPVRFENHVDANAKRESVNEVISIGRQLSKAIDRKKTISKYHGKYRIIRVRGAKTSQKFDADIFTIDPDAKVTHIRYVRRIVEGYLMEKYKYNPGEAATIALYAIYYNARHRGDINYFSDRYKEEVIKYLSKDTAGISTKYYNWPGNTRILIPLSEGVKKTISAVDPDALTEKATSAAVRGNGRNIQARKEMTGLREKVHKAERAELIKQEQKTKEKHEEIEKKESALSTEEARLKAREKALEEREKALKKEEQTPEAKSDPETAQKTAAKKQDIEKEKAKIRDERSALKDKKTELEEEKKSIQAKEKSMAEKKEGLEKRESAAATEKRLTNQDEIDKKIRENPTAASTALKKKAMELAEREEELDRREDQLRDAEPDRGVFAEKFYYLKIKNYLEGGHYRNDMFMIDARSSKIIFKSPADNIAGRRYDVFSGGVIVITFDREQMGNHRLTLLDRTTLIPLKNSREDIFWRSFVEIKENSVFAIVIRDKGYYLGKFNNSLGLTAISKEQVDRDSFITFYNNRIYINKFDKKIIILKKDDLSQVGIVNP